MLADAEVQVPAAASAGLEVARALEGQDRLVRGAEIRRSTEQPGNVLGKNIEDLTGGIAPGDASRIGGKNRQALIPSPRQLALLHQVDLVCELRIFRAISCKELAPLTAGFFPTRANSGGEVLAHRIGNEKLRVLRPAVSAFDKANLVLAQRLAVRRGSVLLVRRAVADMAVQNDEGWAPLGLVKDVQGLLDPVDVVGVADAQNVPAVTEEPGGDVFGKGDACVAFDRDMVVVVNPAEIIEGEMAGKRCRFRTDALHHAAVTAYRINIVAEDLEAGPIVAVRQPCFGNGHAHAGGDALSERPRRRLDS